MASTPDRGGGPLERPRLPLSAKAAVGVLAVLGAIAVARWVLSIAFGLLTLVVVVAVVVIVVRAVVSARGR